jgi:predicted nucleic acid-binding protein
MDGRAIVDTGFIVALLNRDDTHHAWATRLVPSLRGPWLTAEACVSESAFLLEAAGRVSVERLFGWLEQGLLLSRHFLPESLEPVRREMFRYKTRWVDFADACLVALSDERPKLPVVTVDGGDFAVYFRGRTARRLLAP